MVRPELYIGQTVNIKIDRPLGSLHPYHKEIVFCLNYGYLPAVLSADGDDLDAYLLGVFEPVSEYTGRCIAVIKRRDEDDPKLVVVPEGKEYSDEQIIGFNRIPGKIPRLLCCPAMKSTVNDFRPI